MMCPNTKSLISFALEWYDLLGLRLSTWECMDICGWLRAELISVTQNKSRTKIFSDYVSMKWVNIIICNKNFDLISRFLSL